MPEYVLRHPELPDQPIVVDLPEGVDVAKHPSLNSGWEVDENTTPADLAATDVKPVPEPDEPTGDPEPDPNVPNEPAQPETPKE